jgi:hypothetical protein
VVRLLQGAAATLGAACLLSACTAVWGFGDLTVAKGVGDATTDRMDAALDAEPDDAASPEGAAASHDATAASPDVTDSVDASPDEADVGSGVDSGESGVTDGSEEAGPTVRLTISVTAYGPTTGMLESTPSGIHCSGSCTQTLDVAPGTPVHLAVTGATGTLMRWSGSCAGTGSTCDLTPTGALSVTLVLSAWNYAFVTSATQLGDFGGLSPVDSGLPPADAICAQAATAANLPGRCVAYFSTSSMNASARLAGARGWIRVDGAPVFDSAAATGLGAMLYPLDLDETGHKQDSCVWTSSNIDGTFVDGCSGWTSSTDVALAGVSTLETGGWSNNYTVWRCSSSCSLYCFGTDLDAPLTVTPATGRIAFLSSGTWSPSSGAAAANSLCALEAAASSLPGTYDALLASSTQSAIAAGGFSLSGPTWVRPDGVAIATNASAFAIGTLTAAIDVHADGTYASSGGVWTGASSPSTAGTAPATCANWSDGDAGSTAGLQGAANSVDPQFFDSPGYPNCSQAEQVFCLQQ